MQAQHSAAVHNAVLQPMCPQLCRASPCIPRQQHRRRRVRCLAAAAAEPVCLAQMSSQFNPTINVWAVPDDQQFPAEIRHAVILTLDPSGNVHSIYRQDGSALTGAYWDALALLPALVPPGPLMVLGLGAGTTAHLIHHLYPQRIMHGWELDPAVVALAQQHMGMSSLEQAGCLVAHVGDALADSAAVEGGAAGIIVDLFADGQLLPQLTQVSVWRSIRQRLGPGGRVLANLGVVPGGTAMAATVPAAHMARTVAALDAMTEAFEGQLVCSPCVTKGSSNMLALTGPPPSPQEWAAVPPQLQQHAKGARFFGWQTHTKYKESLSQAFFEF